MPDTLTPPEALIVRLIDRGYTRHAIADIAGLLPEGTNGVPGVREIVRDLCERFDCRMTELPTEIDPAAWRGNPKGGTA